MTSKFIHSDNPLISECKVNIFLCSGCGRFYLRDSKNKDKRTRNPSLNKDSMPKYKSPEMKLTEEEKRIREKNKMTEKELEQYIKECKVDKSVEE